MSSHALLFRLVRCAVLDWIPTRGVKTPFYLPVAQEVPDGDIYTLGFDFPATAALANLEHAEAVRDAFLLTHILGFSDAPQGSFFLQIYHQHGQEQRQLFTKPMKVENVAGSAQFPLILPSTYLIGAGDTITVAIANTGQNVGGAYVVANIQVALWGIHPAMGPGPGLVNGRS